MLLFNVQHKTSNMVATLGGKLVVDAMTVSHKSSRENRAVVLLRVTRLLFPTVSDWFHSAAAVQLLK